MFLVSIWAFAINTSVSGSTYLIAVTILMTYTLFYIIRHKQTQQLIEVLILLKIPLFIALLICLTMTISNTLNYNSTYSYSWYTQFAFIYCYIAGIISLTFLYYKKLLTKKTIITFIIIILAINALFLFLQKILGISIHSHGIWWKWGFSNNKNDLGGLMSFAFLICFFIRFKYLESLPRVKRYVLNVLIAIFIICIIFTSEKASWITLAICLSIYSLINIKTLKKQNIIFTILILLCISVTIFFLKKYNIIGLSSLDNSSASRMEAWKCGIDYFLQNPIFGNGFIWKSIDCPIKLVYPHNSTVESLFALGLVGSIVVAVFFLVHAIKAIKTKNIEWLVILLFLLIYSQFDHSLYTWQYFYPWILIISFFIFSDEIKAISHKK